MSKLRYRLRRLPATVIIILYILIILVPILWAFSISIKPESMAMRLPPVWDFTPTFIAYLELFTVHSWEKYLINSIFTSVSTLTIALLLGSMAAYTFARFKTGGKGLIYAILVVQLIPPMVITFPLYLTIRALGLIDTVPGLVFAQLTYNIPFCCWTMRQFFMQVPSEIDEAASIDGASRYRTFFQIILPIAAPGMVSCGIFTFLGSWNDFLFPLILTNTKAQTVTLAAANFITVYNILWTHVDAGAFVLAVPPVILTLFTRKYIVAGLAGDASKG